MPKLFCGTLYFTCHIFRTPCTIIPLLPYYLFYISLFIASPVDSQTNTRMTLHNVAKIKSKRSLTKRTKLSCTVLSHQPNFKSLRHWNSIKPCTEERASGPLWLLQNRHALCFVLSFPKTTGTIGLRSIILFTVPKIRFLNNNYSDTLMKMLPK